MRRKVSAYLIGGFARGAFACIAVESRTRLGASLKHSPKLFAPCHHVAGRLADWSVTTCPLRFFSDRCSRYAEIRAKSSYLGFHHHDALTGRLVKTLVPLRGIDSLSSTRIEGPTRPYWRWKFGIFVSDFHAEAQVEKFLVAP